MAHAEAVELASELRSELVVSSAAAAGDELDGFVDEDSSDDVAGCTACGWAGEVGV